MLCIPSWRDPYPFEVLGWFKAGYDTYHIARCCRCDESTIYNMLARYDHARAA